MCFSCFLVCFMKLKNKILNLFQFDLVFQTYIKTTKINIPVSKQPKQVQHRLAVVALYTDTHRCSTSSCNIHFQLHHNVCLKLHAIATLTVWDGRLSHTRQQQCSQSCEFGMTVSHVTHLSCFYPLSHINTVKPSVDELKINQGCIHFIIRHNFFQKLCFGDN